MAKLPILYDLENNRIILEKVKASDEQKDSNDYVDILGYCAFDEDNEDNMFVLVNDENKDSVFTCTDFHTFKNELAPADEGLDLNKFVEYEQDTLQQLRDMLGRCPYEDSYIAKSLKEQIKSIEDSLVPAYYIAERIIRQALLNANYLYDPILKDVVQISTGNLTMSDFDDLKSGELIVYLNSFDNAIQYIVFDKFEKSHIHYQFLRSISNDGQYVDEFFDSKVYFDDENVTYRRCGDAEKIANDIAKRNNVDMKLFHGAIEIGYKKDIEKFKDAVSAEFELKNGRVYRTELGNRPALIEYNANWRSRKRYNVILYTDDFSLVYPDECSIELKPKDLLRKANKHERAAFDAIIKEFTSQTENGNREDGYEKFGKTDECIIPVMGCSGTASRDLIADYPKGYAEDMEKFKKFRESLRQGDVLEVTLTNSRGGGTVFIRYTGEHPEGEPENFFQFDAMQTNDVITTFFTYKEKPVASVAIAHNYSTCDFLKNFRTKVAAIEEELFEPADSEEKQRFEDRQKIAAELDYPAENRAVFLSYGNK